MVFLPHNVLSGSRCRGKLVRGGQDGEMAILADARLMVLCGDDRQIGEEFVSPRIRYEIYHDGEEASSEAPGLPQAIERLERTMILDHLKQARWNKTKAAVTLGISRRNLIRKVKTFELDRRRNR